MLKKWNIKYNSFIDQNFEEFDLLAYISAIQGGPEALVSPENVLEVKNLGPHFRTTKSETPGGGSQEFIFTSPLSDLDVC